MYCKKCGREISSDAKFCSYCGHKVEEIKEKEKPEKEIKTKADVPEPKINSEEKGQKMAQDFHIESFNWDLEGFPSNTTEKTDEIDFNWDSVLEKKRAEEGYDEPISFETKKAEKQSTEERPEEVKPEKYTLSDIFTEEENSEETSAQAEKKTLKKNDDIVELSFEDDFFDDIKPQKESDATIRIDQTVHFTDQLYSFDNKQAEYQSVLDEEYEKLRNGEQDEEEDSEPEEKKKEASEASEERKKTKVISKEEVEKLIEKAENKDLTETEPEFSTGVKSDEFLRELYGENATKETEEAVSGAEGTEEQAADSDKTEEATPSSGKVEEALSASEETEEAAQETAELKIIHDDEEDDTEEDEEENVQSNSPEYVGVSLAKTPRGVLVIEKNKKDKLVRRTVFPSSDGENENSEEKDNEKSEKKKNKKLSFDDVFNDSNDISDDTKPQKKGKTLKVIAGILCVLVILELIMIGVQYFAPDSSMAKSINHMYGSVISKIMPEEKKSDKMTKDDLVVTSPLDEYTADTDETYEGISEINTDVDLQFGENRAYDFEGYENAGTFEDDKWYKDDDGNPVYYGEAVVKGVAEYYSALVAYKNGKSEEIYNKITGDSPLYEKIGEYEVNKNIISAINVLTLGELMVSAEYADSESEKVSVETNAVMLEPVDQEMKVNSIIEL